MTDEEFYKELRRRVKKLCLGPFGGLDYSKDKESKDKGEGR